MSKINPSVLVVDVGNTSTSAGIYRDGKVRTKIRLESSVQAPSRIVEVLTDLPHKPTVTGAVLCSVVPSVVDIWQAGIRTCYGVPAAVVDHTTELGVKLTYPKPETIGPDRLANACGAMSRYGAPVVVADFGTALTFDVVTEKQGYIGGLIAPGLPLMFNYMAEKTALLPLIKPAAVRRTIGKSTEEAMQIGARVGYRGMVREMIHHIESAVGTDYTLCTTGGHAAWVLKGLDIPFKQDVNLTLYGLGRIWELNEG